VFLSPKFHNLLLDPTIINQIIYAELPTPDTDPDGHLTAVVKSTLMYGPYSIDNFDTPYIASNDYGGCKECLKRFLKLFLVEIIVQDNSYPVYRRQNNG